MARTVLSTKHLYDLLADSPDRPSVSTVKRWVEGKQQIPGWVMSAIARSLGLSPDIEKEAPPHWAARLLDKIDAIYERQGQIYERQGVVADEAIVKLTRVLATGGGSERVGVMRAALADALAETAHGAQPLDEPAEATSEAEAAGGSTPPLRPSDRSLEG